MSTLGIGFHGLNGHQIHERLTNHPRAKWLGLCGCAAGELKSGLPEGVRHFQSLGEMLEDPRIGLVSLCSPRRSTQADDAIQCLEAGKHVYAEKPAAMNEADLDRVLEAASRAERVFREMNGVATAAPYAAMGRAIADGAIGPVVQALAQKSYPYHEGRPQDEQVDGGLIRQVAIHGVRMIEGVTGLRTLAAHAVATSRGNPAAGELTMACTLTLHLERGAIGTVVANYLNQRSFGTWGNDHLRVFGVDGFVESVDGESRTRLVTAVEGDAPLPEGPAYADQFDALVDCILDGRPMPMALEAELHPTRIVLRAAAACGAR